jgi:hypothetical protein
LEAFEPASKAFIMYSPYGHEVNILNSSRALGFRLACKMALTVMKESSIRRDIMPARFGSWRSLIKPYGMDDPAILSAGFTDEKCYELAQTAYLTIESRKDGMYHSPG